MERAIRIFPVVLILFHLIGIGLFVYFAKAPEMSYLNIFLSAILVLASEKRNIKSLVVFGLIFTLGFIIELIGVQTGFLFGSYTYEKSMGPLIFGTPVIIGATWYAVVVGASSIAQKLKFNMFIQAIVAGLLAVAMDILIEQVATKYGLWSWEGGVIPFFNYLCWFIFGSAFSIIYLKSSNNLNKTARYLYFIWLVFFGVLTFAI